MILSTGPVIPLETSKLTKNTAINDIPRSKMVDLIRFAMGLSTSFKSTSLTSAQLISLNLNGVHAVNTFSPTLFTVFLAPLFPMRASAIMGVFMVAAGFNLVNLTLYFLANSDSVLHSLSFPMRKLWAELILCPFAVLSPTILSR